MKKRKQGMIIRSQICPIHLAHPTLNIDNDHFIIRCCCNFLTQRYVEKLKTKLKGLTFESILSRWENDLLVNELQTNKKVDNRQAINSMLTNKN